MPEAPVATMEISRESTKRKLEEVNDSKKKEYKLDRTLVTKAVEALLKYHQTKAEEKQNVLLGTEEMIHLQIGTETEPPKPHPTPFSLRVPHSIYRIDDDSCADDTKLEDADVCLFVKDDHTKSWVQELVDKFPKEMRNIKQIYTLDQVRRKFARYKQRRDLHPQFTLFLVDRRIQPMMLNALGKTFTQVKKQPVPLDLRSKTALPRLVRRALNSTYFILTVGKCFTIKAGWTHMSSEQLVDNCMEIAEKAVHYIPNGWANIRSIGIKTATSTLLPVFNQTPEDLHELTKLAGLKPTWIEMKQKQPEERGSRSKRRKTEQSPLLRALKKTKEAEKKANSEKTEKQKDTEKGEEEESETSGEKENETAKDNIEKPNDTEADVKGKESKTSEEKTRDGSKKEKKGKMKPDDDDSKKTVEASAEKVNSEKVDKRQHETKLGGNKKERRNSKAKGEKETTVVSTTNAGSNETNVNKAKGGDATLDDNKKEKKGKKKPGEDDSKKTIERSTEKVKLEKVDKKVQETKPDGNKKERRNSEANEEKDKTVSTNDVSSAEREVNVSKSIKSSSKDLSPRVKGTGEAQSPKKRGASADKETKATGSDKKRKIDSDAEAKVDDTPKDFIPSKKYTGSKKGYVFKRSSKGVGYHLDILPVVDKAALAALLRSAQQRRGGGGGGEKRKFGKQSKRRGRR